MFSKGQVIFGVLFAIAFIAAMIWSYRKDLKLHRIYYSKVGMVGVIMVLVIAIFAFLAFYLRD